MFDRLETWLNWLATSPVEFIIYLVFQALAVLSALTLHELAHGYVAYRCGDPTAKMLGRLSLNPAKHLDPFGTASLFLLGFGWAKPVPVNPRNFRNARRDDLLVSIAGVTVNLSLFVMATALLVGLRSLVWNVELASYAALSDADLVTFPPLLYRLTFPEDAQFMNLLLKSPVMGYVQQFLTMFASVNLGLGLFNLIPLPPLDGFHVVNDVLLKGRLQMNSQAFRIAHTVVLVLCFSGALSGILGAAMEAVQSGVIHFFLMMIGRG